MATRSYLTPEVATGETDAGWIEIDSRSAHRRGLHWPHFGVVPGLETAQFTPSDALQQVRKEFARCRRFERSFALVRLVASVQSRSLLANVREVDVVWVDRGRVYALLPETDRSGGSGFVERLGAAGLWSAGGDAGVAVFPDDGLTSDALFAALEHDPDALPSRRGLIRVGGRSAR